MEGSIKAFFDNSMINQGLRIILFILVLLFSVSLFKNISYPLFWADESITVMMGKRILEFGYPKVHDGKNVVYDLLHPNPSLGIDKKTDAYIGGGGWGMYYFAALGVKLAYLADDFYLKTAIIRAPFALIGFAGLAILAFISAKFFQSETSKISFIVIFAIFLLSSVPLVLHLREARYYSLTVFFVALTIFLHVGYRLLQKIPYLNYLLLVIVSLFFMFITFAPVYFIFIAALLIHESLLLVRKIIIKYREGKVNNSRMDSITKEPFGYYIRSLLVLLVSLITVLPLIYFFETFHISSEMVNFNTTLFHVSKMEMYLENITSVWRFFKSTGFIYPALFLKVSLLYAFIVRTDKKLTSSSRLKNGFSNFLTVLFMTYCFAIAKIPNFTYTRYFIVLQPILAIIIILDFSMLYEMLKGARLWPWQFSRVFIFMACIGLSLPALPNNFQYLKEHVYELSHQYKGPLDHLIPFIKKAYKNTDSLAIATNYEETSFMYYLNAKVTIGYVGNNLDQDYRTVPDIVVYRKKHWANFLPLFLNFLNNYSYRRISFPVADYPVNNIPELNWLPSVRHQFRTPLPADELAKADMYLRI